MISVRPGPGRSADLGPDAEFLAQFANQRDVGRLTRFDLAAWEFPQSGEVATLGAAGQQDASVCVAEDAGDNVDLLHEDNHAPVQ